MIQIVGDGLAGTLLAHRLGNRVELVGDGRSNTPPGALVHLFAGRSFRRTPLEVRAFQEAIRYWRCEPLAQETTVRRTFQAGDRLDRSLAHCAVPEEFLPCRVSPGVLEYGPAFSVSSMALRERLIRALGPLYHQAHVDLGQAFGGVRVLATGRAIQHSLTRVAWDLSSGECLTARADSATEQVHIGAGLHIAPWEDGVVIGGAADLTKASELAGKSYELEDRWKGDRCANALDRWPVLGWLDSHTFVFASFGSRGLFWLPYCLKLAEQALETHSNDPIPEGLRHTRF